MKNHPTNQAWSGMRRHKQKGKGGTEGNTEVI